jgi:hypothetical protein
MAVPGMFRYHVIAISRGPEALRILSRPDKTFVIALGMMVAALVAAMHTVPSYPSPGLSLPGSCGL